MFSQLAILVRRAERRHKKKLKQIEEKKKFVRLSQSTPNPEIKWISGSSEVLIFNLSNKIIIFPLIFLANATTIAGEKSNLKSNERTLSEISENAKKEENSSHNINSPGENKKEKINCVVSEENVA